MQIGRSMCPRPQYSDLTTMGGTEPCGPMRINIKFGANRTLYVPKTPVYRFDYCGEYGILWTDEDNFL